MNKRLMLVVGMLIFSISSLGMNVFFHHTNTILVAQFNESQSNLEFVANQDLKHQQKIFELEGILHEYYQKDFELLPENMKQQIKDQIHSQEFL